MLDVFIQIIKVIMMEVVGHLVVALGLCLTVVNFLKIIKACRKLFGRVNKTENHEQSVKKDEGHDEDNFKLPLAVHDVQNREENYDEDIKLILQTMELRKLKEDASNKKPFMRKCLRMILQKGLFF